MKKTLIFLLLLFSFILISCGEEEGTANEPTIEDAESNPVEEETKVEIPKAEYVATNSLLTFSDDNAEKVITEPTFDITQYTKDAGSGIKPHQLFADGMCLQRDAVNRIWGKASQTKFIAAEINGEVYYGTVTSRNWEIYLPKMNAGGPYELTIISELGRITLKDVYIGEVFFLSGQSNMEWQVSHCGDIMKDLYATDDCINDEIRMLYVPWFLQTDPTLEVLYNCKWTGANKKTISSFSAVGYLFGKQMQEELGCPVGLIWSAVGGTNIECWLSEENYNKVSEIYRPYVTNDLYMTPSLAYNGMLYPFEGLNVRSVLWYQGESNAFGTQDYYDQALEIFIEQCRELFNNDNLGFTLIELARYEGLPYAYSVVNEKMNAVASEDPYVVVARNLDLGDWFDIHPKNKFEIGSRAAYETLRVFFKSEKAVPVEVSDYVFNADGTVTINLSSPVSLLNGNNGFEVKVNGNYTYNCTVTINCNQLTVSASGNITEVRYGYTCLMTDEIKSDVSKMVTIYDENGFPLDLFWIVNN